MGIGKILLKKSLMLFLIILLIIPTAHGQNFTQSTFGDLSNLGNLVPDTEHMFGLNSQDYTLAPEQIPEDLKNKIEGQMQLSVQSAFEAFFLNSALYMRFNELERIHGREGLIKRLKEKSDDVSVKYEQEGVGKAELILLGRGSHQIPVTMIRLNSGRYILFLDTSLYDPEIFKEKIPAEFSENQIKLELKLRSVVKGLVHGLISELLISGKKGGAHVPLYKLFKPEAKFEDIQNEITKNESPLIDRYMEIEETLSRIETSDRTYLNLVAEREMIEETIMKLRQDKTTFWGKMVLTGSSTLSPDSSPLGQPTTIVYHNQGQFLNSENIERPHEDTFKDSIHKWKTYAKSLHESMHIDWDTWYREKGLAKLKILQKGDLYYQYLNTPVQVGLAMLSGFLLVFFTTKAPNWGAMGMNALFTGMIIGLNIRTFLKWSLSGTELSKSLKDTALGITFALTAYLFDTTKTIADMTTGIWISLIGSQLFKNLVKKGPREYQAFKKRSGQASGEYATPIEEHFLDIKSKGEITSTYQVRIPTRILRYIFRQTLRPFHQKIAFRTEKIGETPREISNGAMLSTDMIVRTYVPKTMGSYNALAFVLGYMQIGPYWEYKAVLDKEAYADRYEKEQGATKPKAKEYRAEAMAARARWESYKLINGQFLKNMGIDVGRSKLFEKGIVFPSQYIGYYVDVFREVYRSVYTFFSEKPLHRRLHEYIANAYYHFKVQQYERNLKSKSIINLNFPLQRETRAELKERRQRIVFYPANCAGYFRTGYAK